MQTFLDHQKANYPLILVAAGLLEDDRGRILLTQRRADDRSFPLTWEFPGGKCEPNETPEETLARELREEIHIIVSHDSRYCIPWGFVSHPYETFHLLMVVFRCTKFVGEPKKLQVHDLNWFAPHELTHLRTPPADRPLVKKLLQERSIAYDKEAFPDFIGPQ